MDSSELRRKYIEFFKERGHKEIPSASLVPENDPSVLFTTAGMHPLVPYLMGEKHPSGTKLVDAQLCLRTDDIDEVGDTCHHTFFEMLGNWSLGDYWKKDAIKWSHEFLVNELNLNPEKLAVSCFEGDLDAPKDEESAEVWRSLGVANSRIAFLPKMDNWWGPAGETGPCGPDSEMFYWTGEGYGPENFQETHEDAQWVEIWNDVFMQYNKKKRVLLVDGMHALYDEEFKSNQELLGQLDQINCQKILVVNGHGDKARELFGPLGYEVFTLEMAVTKDNKDFFVKLNEKYQLDFDDYLYFDHKQENLNGAKSAGINQTYLFSLGEDIIKLRAFIDQNLYKFEPLSQKNVDTGMGLERTLAILNGTEDNYRTELFWPIIQRLEELSTMEYGGKPDSEYQQCWVEVRKHMRVIADHLKAAVFVLAEGVVPANKLQGYILRRLIRRAVVKANLIGVKSNFTASVAEIVAGIYKSVYPKIDLQLPQIIAELEKEENRFRNTLEKGLKMIGSVEKFDGKILFDLYQSYGIPVEISQEEAERLECPISSEAVEEYRALLIQHQEQSRTASAGMFKGGLADAGEETTKLHTAAHLMLAALRQVLGSEVTQKGSNITAERLRFDFNYPEKLSEDQIWQVENIVNEKIEANLLVTMEEMSINDAKNSGAMGVFDERYGEKVKVYTIGDNQNPFSREICGGPHVKSTGELGHFKIAKEESSSAGVRRIKAILE